MTKAPPRLFIDDDIFPAEGSRAGRAWRRAWLVARGAPDRADLRSYISWFSTIGFVCFTNQISSVKSFYLEYMTIAPSNNTSVWKKRQLADSETLICQIWELAFPPQWQEDFWVQAAEEAGRQVKRDDNSEERMEAEFLKPLINVGPFWTGMEERKKELSTVIHWLSPLPSIEVWKERKTVMDRDTAGGQVGNT